MRVQTLTPVLLFALLTAGCGTNSESSDEAEPTTAAIDTDEQPAEGAHTAPVDRGRVPVIVDYSPTTSDITALLYVTQHPSADLLAVTLAGTGEAHCDRGVANTRELLAFIGLPDIPVACGQTQTVGAGNEWPANWREAADRLDGLELLPADPVGGDADAAELLASSAADHGSVTIIALGPLTNVAVAIDQWPDLPKHVAEIVTMGGALDVEGNATNGVAEWNYFIDPSAVDVVLQSGIPVTMVPLDATNSVPVTQAWFDALTGHRITAAAHAVHDLFAASRPYESGFFFWDELVAVVAFDPTVVTLDQQPVVIDLDGVEQGRTRIDPSGATVRIAVDADRERFERELLTTLNGGVERPAVPAASDQEAQYFLAVGVVVAEMRDAIELLFQTPLEQELEAIEQRAENDALTPEDEATIRAFFTGFWTGADEHLKTFRDDLGELNPPAAVRSEHDDYIAAVNALIETTDDRLNEITTRDPAELLSSLWEPDDEIEAMSAACETLGAADSCLGIDASTCP
jgi:inosine-uridine nucleoside N-ribohydrolase